MKELRTALYRMKDHDSRSIMWAVVAPYTVEVSAALLCGCAVLTGCV